MIDLVPNSKFDSNRNQNPRSRRHRMQRSIQKLLAGQIRSSKSCPLRRNPLRNEKLFLSIPNLPKHENTIRQWEGKYSCELAITRRLPYIDEHGMLHNLFSGITTCLGHASSLSPRASRRPKTHITIVFSGPV